MARQVPAQTGKNLLSMTLAIAALCDALKYAEWGDPRWEDKRRAAEHHIREIEWVDAETVVEQDAKR